MIDICRKEYCTGCGLCVSQCPKQCISLQVDAKFGHLYPHIEQTTCIDCGLCQKKCPANHAVDGIKPKVAYAAWSKDEEDYRSSTSGGAASVLSHYIISKGGVVYGCAMLPDIDVRHIRIDRLEDIPKLKGSKYVQSSITEIISQLKSDVKNGKDTLFIGTPCQVAALRSIYKDQPENLYLVDLICHGVPSLSILKKHIKKVADYPHYDNIIFRESSYIVVVVVDGQVVYKCPFNRPRYKDWYINTFFDGYTYRDSCYHCHYACPERISDITVGDFWGLGKKKSAKEIPPHPNGCSVMMPITEKGQVLIDSIREKMNVYERDVEEAVAGNSQLRTPCSLTLRRKFFRVIFPYIGRSAYWLAVLDKYIKYQMLRGKNSIINKR